jgi:hypothetical protein
MMILQALKFVSLVHLSAVRRLVDVLDSAEAESGVIAIGSLFHSSHTSLLTSLPPKKRDCLMT